MTSEYEQMNTLGYHSTDRMIREKIEKIIELIEQTAPRPGRLVYLTARQLPFLVHGLPPLLLISFDVCTHLQLARVYLTPTTASAIDFLSYIGNEYPFSIEEIRTLAVPPFCASSEAPYDSRFSMHAKRHGIAHSVLQTKRDDIVFYFLNPMIYQGEVNCADPVDEDQILHSIQRALFFHNNQRVLPTLRGRTPLQRLHMFDGFGHIVVFNPGSADIQTAPSKGRVSP